MSRFFHVLIVLFLAVIQLNCQTNEITQPKVKSIVLLIGDGMGLAQVYAAMSVAKDKLNIERAKYVGLSKTYSTSEYTTDSGAAATAFATGSKTKNYAISVDRRGKELKTITEYVQEAGMSTGIVTTCNLNHATPASFVSKNKSRQNYEQITNDFEFCGVDVLIGGGSRIFDSLGVTNRMMEKGYLVQPVLDEEALNSESPILSLQYEGHPPSIIEGRSKNYLEKSTIFALNKLSRNTKGFFLMVEGSQIDWGGHDNDIDYVVTETLDFDKAIGAVFNFADANPGTLVIVTADHETGGLTLPDGKMPSGKVEAQFSTLGHTGVMVPIFAYGTGAEEFSTIMDNTDIFFKMLAALGLQE